MEFGLLGPLEVRCGDTVAAIRAGRPRALLIALLLRAGRAVTADVLVDEVWGERPPIDAGNALQVQVSYLRKALRQLDPDATPLVTVPGGYRLDVAAEQLDVHRFERALAAATAALQPPVTAADAEVAHTAAVAALATWRGEALLDVSYEPFAAAEIARLNELRVAAGERAGEALLALGRPNQAVALLRPLVVANPLREHARAQLVLALYRDGRQAEALREYDAVRRLLDDELGVEPSANLQRLHLAVLEQRPELDWGGAGPSPDDAPLDGAAGTGGVVGARDGGSRLPTPLTALVGREREVDALVAAIEHHRLVSVTGPGGVGKTRVALAAARRLAVEQPVWLVELADLGAVRIGSVGVDDIGDEIAAVLGVVTHGDVVEALAVRLGVRRAVLVLDTCEHLVGPCGELVERLLRSCPELTVVATSRQVLGVDGEVVVALGPMAVPGTASTFEQIAGSEAVVLFRQRARAARPDFELDATTAPTVARICAVLDGLPLAIELAAARANVLDVAAIADLLDHRFEVVRRSGGSPRQRSLAGAIDWSYQLLDDDQRRSFRCLGVLEGSFGLELAAAVVGAEGATAGLAVVTELIERSLVIHDGGGSYRLLDSLRQFAAERLDADSAEHARANAAMADWLVVRGQQLEPLLGTIGQGGALVELRRLLPNVRAAIAWTRDSGRADDAARLAVPIAWMWALDAGNREAVALLSAVYRPELPAALAAQVLETLGMHQLVIGDVAAARRSLEQAVAAWAASPEPGRAGFAHTYVGVARTWSGDHAGAVGDGLRAVELADTDGDRWLQAWSRTWLARTAVVSGDDDWAAELLAAAAEIGGDELDRRSHGWIIAERAALELRRGGPDGGALAEAAVRMQRDEGWVEGLVHALAVRSQARSVIGAFDEAVVDVHRALQLAAELDQPYVLAATLDRAVEVLLGAGRHQLAAQCYGQIDAVVARLGLTETAERRRHQARRADLAAVMAADELARHTADGHAATTAALVGRFPVPRHVDTGGAAVASKSAEPAAPDTSS